jgi:deferrochelatase/peroxidase EfeB
MAGAAVNEARVNAHAVDFADVQGLARFGHGRLQESAFLLLRVADAAAAKSWLAGARVTTALRTPEPPDRALQVAFAAPGLQALGVAPAIVAQFAAEFVDGMSGDRNRSRRLGDTGTNAPGNWRWGGDEAHIPHVLVMLYALPGRLHDYMAEVRDAAFDAAFTVDTALVSTSAGPNEPFGFADGISQPTIDWEAAFPAAATEHDAYTNRIAAGEILLGYPNEYGLHTERPLLPPGEAAASGLPRAPESPDRADLGQNGTYLVFRQLEQDVRGFWRFVNEQAHGNAAARDRLAAAMTGRKLDGSPLVAPSRRAIPGSDPGDAQNHFTYADDPLGHGCPIGSHVRRSNPRTGDFPVGVTGPVTRFLRTLGFGRRHAGDDLVASSRFHRLLRRGRIYGPALLPQDALVPIEADALAGSTPEPERGLHFVCLCANIARQFEFVQSAWTASPKFAGLTDESDPLLGNREPLLDGARTDRFSMPRAGRPTLRVDALPQFVTVRGGGYFFLPGIRALRFIASQ